MAATSALPISRKRKQMTYGKSARNAGTWHMMTEEDREEDDQRRTVPKQASRTIVKEGTPMKRNKVLSSATEHVQLRAARSDLWSIPSDDELEHSPPTCVARKAVAVSSNRSVSHYPKEAEVKLAPWEQVKSDTGKVMRRDQTTQTPEMESGIASPVVAKGGTLPDHPTTMAKSTISAKDKLAKTASVSSSPGGSVQGDLPSAKARLQAKRSMANATNAASAKTTPPAIPTQKRRAAMPDKPALSGNRKRLRREADVEQESSNVYVHDVNLFERHEPVEEGVQSLDELRVYDFSDEGARPTRTAKPRTAILRSQREVSATRSESYQRNKNVGLARKNDMVSEDMDIDQVPGKSLESSNYRSLTPSNMLSPRSNLATPPRASTPGLGTAIESNGVITPKQAEIWNRLLPSEAHAPSPNLPSIEGLRLDGSTLSTKQDAKPLSVPPTKTYAGLRRPKLVDRLKAATQSSDDEMSESSDDESARSSARAPATLQRNLSHVSQKQSQNVLLPASGASRVTYARTRSHLQDTFENDLLLSMPAAATEHAPASRALSTKTPSALPTSSWDFTDSGDELGGRTKGFMSINELRAGGSNARFRNDVSSLLEDISDHHVSARSRRRSAAMELALKLTEKDFAQRFCGHGFERQLVNECAASADAATNFALAASFMILLEGDLSGPVVISLKNADILAWLGRFLSDRRDVKALSGDRNHNMSKSAQKSLSEFSVRLAANDLWGAHKPSSPTLRTISLKAIELLIRRLRRNADASELLDIATVEHILPLPTDIDLMNREEVVTIDTIVAISLLESYALPTLSSTWTTNMLNRITSMLTSPALAKFEARHTYFLLLRLCNSITNQDQRSCKIFSENAAMSHILVAIQEGFNDKPMGKDEAQSALDRDVLVLELGLLIALTDRSPEACQLATIVNDGGTLSDLVRELQRGRKHADEAETVEAVEANVVHGYLAVALANICQNPVASKIVAINLPGRNLNVLVDAVEEFVMYHQEVDRSSQSLAEREGDTAVWSTFTELLKGVLARLKSVVAG